MSITIPEKFKKRMILNVDGAREIDGRACLGIDSIALRREGDEFVAEFFYENTLLGQLPFGLEDGETAHLSLHGYVEVKLL